MLSNECTLSEQGVPFVLTAHAVDVSKFKYNSTNYDISVTKILGGTLYENITDGRGQRIQKPKPSDY